VRLAGRAFPSRMQAARVLRQIYAERGASGRLAPTEAARLIVEVFRLVQGELAKVERYLGDSFGIARLIGLLYSYDDIAFDDTKAAEAIERDLLDELRGLAADNAFTGESDSC
jgi:hypothetical protein